MSQRVCFQAKGAQPSSAAVSDPSGRTDPRAAGPSDFHYPLCGRLAARASAAFKSSSLKLFAAAHAARRARFTLRVMSLN